MFIPKIQLTANGAPTEVSEHLLCVGVTHKRATISELDASTFKDAEAALREMRLLSSVHEVVLIQTCNRVEIYAVTSEQDREQAETEVIDYWRRHVALDAEEFSRRVEESHASHALLHILRLASGLESMIVGEDQILGQLQDAFNEAKECGTVGPILGSIFESAIHLGKAVRAKTKINKGAVSIGSAAVNLLEEEFGDLSRKKFMVIGAGQLGSLVSKALAARKALTILVANRTYVKAVWLAKVLGAHAVRFEKVKDFLAYVDVVIVATSAPHFVLTSELVEQAIQSRPQGRLLIMDLSQPRNVDGRVASLRNVEVRNVDNLREVAALNLQRRLKEVKKVERMIMEEFERVQQRLKRAQVEPLIATICKKAEEIRCAEIEKALHMMSKVINTGGGEERWACCMKVLEDFSRELTGRILLDPLTNLRTAAVRNDLDKISAARELFNVRGPS